MIYAQSIFFWFIKVKNVKSSSFSHSIESAESLFYRLRHKKLIINDLQILWLHWPDKRNNSEFRNKHRQLCIITI